MKMSSLQEHYPGISPIAFIELSIQIQQLYDGPWVQIGDCPEEGTNNPNPIDQEKARGKWRKAYMKLKPFENRIEEDYSNLGTPDSPFISDDTASRAIESMHAICERYHNVVELWDETEDDSSGIWDDIPVELSAPEKVPYDMTKAMDYYSGKERDFDDNKLPIIKDRLERWWKRIPEGKHEDAVKGKIESYRDELQKSGFLEWYGADLTPGFLTEMIPLCDSNEEAQRMYNDEQFFCDFNDLYGKYDVLELDKIEKYCWENQNRITDSQLDSFFTYEKMRQYLPERLRRSGAEGLVEEFSNALRVSDKTKGNLVMGNGISPDISDHVGFVVEMYDIGEDKPQLSSIFSRKKLDTTDKQKRLIQIIRTEISPKTSRNKGPQNGKWNWGHVKAAMEQVGLIDKNCENTAFGKAIHEIDSTRTEKSVEQACKRYSYAQDGIVRENIISEIKSLLDAAEVRVCQNEIGASLGR